MIIKSLIISILLIGSVSQIFAQREFKTQGGDTTYTMKRYVFMLLKQGPKQDQDSMTLSNMMKGHMKHINEMAATKKLVVAGPFEDGDKYRGILIFDVDSISEALRIEASDPAVAGGRFEMQAIYWWAAKGTKLP